MGLKLEGFLEALQFYFYHNKCTSKLFKNANHLLT